MPSIQMEIQNETVMRLTFIRDHASQCAIWHRLSGGAILGLFASCGGVRNTSASTLTIRHHAR